MAKSTFENPSIRSDSIEVLSRELMRTTNDLLESNRRLQQAQQERQEMLANISHDLRAPITAIRGAVDCLLTEDGSLSDSSRELLHLIDRRTTTLEDLIKDMYYLFCVEDTSRSLELESIDMAPFLEEYFYSVMLDNRYASHQMVLDVPEALQCTLQIDVHKIVRVLDNLMTNAAKYSAPDTEIRLKAQLTDSALLVSVEDQGVGISPEALPHIFDRTYTVSHARTPNTATGSGLGLSIVQTIMQRHGGAVRCRSQLGEGTAFILSFPCSREPVPDK